MQPDHLALIMAPEIMQGLETQEPLEYWAMLFAALAGMCQASLGNDAASAVMMAAAKSGK